MVFKYASAFLLLFCGFKGVSRENPAGMEKRCYEQLSLKRIPEACYSLSLSTKEIHFLDVKCTQAAKETSSIEVIFDALGSGGISPKCFASLKARAEVISYKIADKSGHKAFRYNRMLNGLKIDKASRHAYTRFKQSN